MGTHATLRAYQGAGLRRETLLAQRSGVQAVREDLSWAKSEPRPGRFSWRLFDSVVLAAARCGLGVLPILDDVPSWTGGPANAMPADPRPFAQFTAAVAARYGPGGALWHAHRELARLAPRWVELFNEPYLAQPSGGRPNPAGYAHVVHAAAVAGRASNPRVHYLLEGETTYVAADQSYQDWMGGLYAAVPDLGRYFDAVAVHPYSSHDPPTRYTPGATRWQARRLEQVRATLVSHGDGAKHLWITEAGWSTCPTGNECVSETKQSTYLHSLFQLARTAWRSYVDAVFVFQLHDEVPRRADDKDQWYGLLRPDLTKKPAWRTVRAEAAQR